VINDCICKKRKRDWRMMSTHEINYFNQSKLFNTSAAIVQKINSLCLSTGLTKIAKDLFHSIFVITVAVVMVVRRHAIGQL